MVVTPVSETDTEWTFELPSDFPKMVDSVFDSLCHGYKDYCFTTKQLKDIIALCRDKKITFLYKADIDKVGDLSYYTLIPGKVICGNKEVENIQCSYSELPSNYTFIPNNSKTDKTMEASYVPNTRPSRLYEINYFDEDGNPVWRKKGVQYFFSKPTD